MCWKKGKKFLYTEFVTSIWNIEKDDIYISITSTDLHIYHACFQNVATSRSRGPSATPDNEKFATIPEKIRKTREERGKIRKKRQTSGRFFHWLTYLSCLFSKQTNKSSGVATRGSRGRVPSLTPKNFPKFGKKSEKLRKKEEKSGRKGRNLEVSFTDLHIYHACFQNKQTNAVA